MAVVIPLGELVLVMVLTLVDGSAHIAHFKFK